MKAYLKELQGQLLGSVTDNDDVRQFFATDASIFTISPEAVVYPRNTADVRKTIKLAAERTQAGKPLSVVPRGKGTDQGGGAVGDGLQLVFPAYMNRLIRLTKDTVTVQPGMSYKALQQILHTHGRFLPPYPASLDYSTVGGAVGNNAAGEKTVKYGATRDFVVGLKVVLADGSLIETRRISARELNRKKGQADLEGDIYRKLDSLILDHEDIIAKAKLKVSKNTAGYALERVRGKDGSFDLGQVIIGAQGTLGVVTEITFKTVVWNQRTTLLVGYFDDLRQVSDAITKLVALSPSALELVDHHLLAYVRRHQSQDLENLLPDTLPKIVLLVEFDDGSQFAQNMHARRAQTILKKHAGDFRVSTDPIEQEALWKIRRSAAAVIWMAPGAKKALPFIEDGIVPAARLGTFLERTYKLLQKYDLDIAVWGHAGDANLHLQPFLDLSKKKDVEKMLDLSHDFTELVISLGGSTSAEHNDGLIRAPYLQQLYGTAMYELLRQTKHIFDPHNVLNPGKKVDVTESIMRGRLRTEYSLSHLSDHLPHT